MPNVTIASFIDNTIVHFAPHLILYHSHMSFYLHLEA